MRRILVLVALMGATCIAFADNTGADRLYRLRCASCHGSTGEKDTMSPIPINTLTAEQIETRLRQAREAEIKGSIDRVKATLTAEQAQAVAQYITETLRQQAAQESAP